MAQAKLAYRLFQEQFSGPRWEALAARGAHPQRPLWASTSTKNPAYPDLLYVDNLIGPHTVNTMPDATVAAFLDHGTVARTRGHRRGRGRSRTSTRSSGPASTWPTWPRCSRRKGWRLLPRATRSCCRPCTTRPMPSSGMIQTGRTHHAEVRYPMSEPVGPNLLAEGLQTTRRAPPGVLVVFGASGDLTSRKLLPALERLSRRRLLDPGFAVVGVARSRLDDQGFRDLMTAAVPDAGAGLGRRGQAQPLCRRRLRRPGHFRPAPRPSSTTSTRSWASPATGPTTWPPSRPCSSTWPPASAPRVSTGPASLAPPYAW